MKKNFLKICIAFFGIALVGCLDDDKYALDPSETRNVIEFTDPSVPSNPAGAIYPVWTAVTEILPVYEFQQEISYSGPNGNSEDIVLTLAVDPVALADYNTQMANDLHGAQYQLMPDNYFDFTDVTVTIPKGEKRASVTITTFPDQFDLTKNFALPLRIVSSSEGVISEHWSVAILAVVVKNGYDGIYKILDGQVTRLGDPVLSGQYVPGLEMPLSTVNGTTVGIVPLWKDGSGIGGVTGTQLAINAATNDVAASSTTNATLTNMAGTIRSYDPATRTIIVSITWSTPGTRMIENLKLQYDRPRP